MKIGFVGAPCAHKTTAWAHLFYVLKSQSWQNDPLLSGLRLKTYDTVCLPEAARMLWEDLNIPSFKTQFRMLCQQIEMEQAVAACPIVLCDRTVMDIPVFMHWLKNKDTSDLWSRQTKFVENIALNYMALYPYDLVFYMNPQPFQNDSRRLGTPEDQRTVDEVFRECLSRWCPDRIVEISEPEPQRFQQILTHSLHCLSDLNEEA